MAICACGFVYFESEQDFDNSVSAWVHGQLRYDGGAIEKPSQFPVCFEYIPPFDAHFCGHWRVQKDPFAMLQAIADREQYFHDIWEKIEEYNYHKKIPETY